MDEAREPHDPKQCPACGGQTIIHGKILFGEAGAAEFYPAGLPWLTLTRSVRLMAGARFFACAACDLVWSNAVPGHLALLAGSIK
jgi:NAD-dependent SIR2 family protein deacetylase